MKLGVNNRGCEEGSERSERGGCSSSCEMSIMDEIGGVKGGLARFGEGVWLAGFGVR